MAGLIFLAATKDSGRDIFDTLPDPPEPVHCPICSDTGIRLVEYADPEVGPEPPQEEPCICQAGQLVADEWAPDYSGYDGGNA